MKSALTKHWLQITLILVVFLVFLSNMLGFFDLNIKVGPDVIRFGGNLFSDPHGNPGLNLPGVVKSPEFFVFCTVGVLLSTLLPAMNPLKASLLTFVAMVPIIWIEVASPGSQAPLPMEYSLLMVLVLFAVNVLISYFIETHRKQELIDIFGQYVPPEVVEILSRNPDSISLDGESRELTVMFCDIHDFTTISEHLDPRTLTRMLNNVFTPVTEILYRHQATIDKYMGDAIMCFWGAPLADPDHASKAVQAAFDIQQMLKALAPEFREQGLPEIRMGIGINTGMASVGNMGSRYRMAYTAVGDAVNLASRIENLTRTYSAPIIVGEGTQRVVEDVLYRELDLVKVKGKHTNTRIYEPMCPAKDSNAELRQHLHIHAQAMEAYYHRDWDKATSLFSKLQRIRPEDKVNMLFLERIEEMRAHPPEPDWQGATAFSG